MHYCKFIYTMSVKLKNVGEGASIPLTPKWDFIIYRLPAMKFVEKI